LKKAVIVVKFDSLPKMLFSREWFFWERTK